MKRDLDLIRAILLAMERCPEPYSNPEIPGATEGEVRGHLQMLVDAGLVDPHPSLSFRSAHSVVFDDYRLTWSGHEFLDNAREEKR